MRVVLQPKICLCEGYRDVGPWSAELFAFADMRHGSETCFALPLRIVDWLIGSAGDGIDDVDHAARGLLAGPFWY